MEMSNLFLIGDSVWSFGRQLWGVIEGFDDSSIYPIKVRFNDGITCTYNEEGGIGNHFKRDLFFQEISVPESAVKRPKWKPKVGEMYYFIRIDYTGVVVQPLEWCEDEVDLGRYKLNNCFKTPEDAQEYVNRVYKAFNE